MSSRRYDVMRYSYYIALVVNRALRVAPTGQRGHMATESGQNVLEAEQVVENQATYWLLLTET